MCCIFPRYVMYYVCRVGVCVSQVRVSSKRLNGYIVHYILMKLRYLQKSGYSAQELSPELRTENFITAR